MTSSTVLLALHLYLSKIDKHEKIPKNPNSTVAVLLIIVDGLTRNIELLEFVNIFIFYAHFKYFDDISDNVAGVEVLAKF